MREEAYGPAVVLDDDDADVVAHATDQPGEFGAEVWAVEPAFDGLDRTPRLDQRWIQFVHGDQAIANAHPKSLGGRLRRGACNRGRSRSRPRPRATSTSDAIAWSKNSLTSAVVAASQP